MSTLSQQQLLALDRKHIWHPYSSTTAKATVYAVESASGAELRLLDGRLLIDGMASWWSAIHGYNHPVLNQAAQDQLASMSHVMFGGLTHEPAVRLAQRLVQITPAPLTRVFFSDSGSVAVEVALKMASQYWIAKKRPEKHQILAIKGGYHGDTFGAMSVCDPDNGMHALFSPLLKPQLFTDMPKCCYEQQWDDAFAADLKQKLEQNSASLAALILEPIVQGAGGMRFYSPEFLRAARRLCDEHDVLLIADEIATGLGRSGQLFGCDHANIAPDIMCLGKALTGGYLSFAATLCTEHIATTISEGATGAFMHGPTFMANPLAAAISLASVDLLLAQDWRAKVLAIEARLRAQLEPCRALEIVADVRTLGAIGVVELKVPAELNRLQTMLVEEGVWLRPFGKLVYMMPPYIISEQQLDQLCQATHRVVSKLSSM